MVWQRLLGPVRFTLVAALLGALLIATAGVVSAAASITFTPNVGGTLIPGTTNSWAIPLTSSTATVDVDCGSATGACSVFAAKNNGTSETLFTNVTGNQTNIPFPFINDGCINLRLYDAGHTQLLGQLNVGHGGFSNGGTIAVCDAAGAGTPILLINGVTGTSGHGFVNGIASTPPAVPTFGMFDSGNSGGIDEAEIWISQSRPGFSFTDCNAISYPNASEVLFTRNASGFIAGPTLTGGGPYCFTLYQGSSHITKIGGAVRFTLSAYLQYVGGTPNGTSAPTQGTVYYNSGNGATNALVCVGGTSTGATLIPFTFNSLGFDSKVASFQTANGGNTQNLYDLRTGVTGLVSGAPTNASCSSGTLAQSFSIHT